MEKSKKFQKGKIETGKLGYLNENCWLVRTLNYAPYKRCQYCKLKFHNCLFLHYQIVSLILILFFLTLSFLIEGRISKLMIISIFTLVIVYGYFFNKSTEKIIKANFAQRKANEVLKELTETLEEQVEQRIKELRKAYEELKKLDRAKSEFISIASHQLRTPLTVIKGYLSMILEGTYGRLSPKAQKPIENIYQSNERLIELINNLLSVSRIESGRMEMHFEKTSLEDIISSLVDELKIEAKKKNIYLNWEKPKEPLPKVLADRDKIRHVIFNIIDNAIKYTKKGRITIKTGVLDSGLRIEVFDTGAGMTKDELSKLFKSFARGTVGSRLYTEGVGLGLYVAKKFVEMHDGSIWAESSGPGKGSTFYIELPIKPLTTKEKRKKIK